MSDIRMRKIRFYYDIVCPYSYMESPTVEAVEDAGQVEVEWRRSSETDFSLR
jgi:2-hydroxychromene-2-carboxylate isomerase